MIQNPFSACRQTEEDDYKELRELDELARLDPGYLWKCFIIDGAVALLCITLYFPLSRTPQLLLSLRFTTASAKWFINY